MRYGANFMLIEQICLALALTLVLIDFSSSNFFPSDIQLILSTAMASIAQQLASFSRI